MLVRWAAAGAVCGACGGGPALPPVDPLPRSTPSVTRDPPAPMRVLSASDDTGTMDGNSEARRLLMVVDRSLAPLSVRPESFVVVTAAGVRVAPVEARFVESSRFGMQRSVLLTGSFGEGLPQALLVVRPLRAAAGGMLHRVSAPLEQRGSRPRVLFWESRSSDAADGCGEGSSVVELWWSRSVRGASAPVEPARVDAPAASAGSAAAAAPLDSAVTAPFYARANHTMHCYASRREPVTPPLVLPAGAVETEDAAPSARAVLDTRHRVGQDATQGVTEEGG